MKVLLRQDVDNLGYAGEVHKVSNGYGRNYLLPRGLAVQATPTVLRAAQAWRERAAARRAELKAEYQALAAQIEATVLVFEAKAGETGKLYGSVTTNDVAERLNETLGTEIDRRKVTGEPLRQLGQHRVNIRLSSDVQAEVTVEIVAEGEPEAEAEDEAALPAVDETVEPAEVDDLDEDYEDDDFEDEYDDDFDV